MDNVSPAHGGFQVFDSYVNSASSGALAGSMAAGLPGALVGGVYAVQQSVARHSETENRFPTDAEMNLMVDRMRMQYLQTYGKEAYERVVTEQERKRTTERIARGETDGVVL